MLALEPIDNVSKVITGKRYLPPLAIRRRVGPLEGQEKSGSEFVTYLKLLGGLSETSRLLDLGCGYGVVALGLQYFIKHPGCYFGVDIDHQVIKWAQHTISAKNPEFHFDYIDIRNSLYNPNGARDPSSVSLPYEPNSFDCILVKSVFTHMDSKEVRHYLSEIFVLLEHGGLCIASLFLLNDRQEELHNQGLNRVKFRFQSSDGHSRYAYEGMSALATAHRESDVYNFLDEAGLTLKATYYGSWSGRFGGLSYQDLLVIGKN